MGKFQHKLAVTAALFAVFAGCGGGGGDTATPAPAPAPVAVTPPAPAPVAATPPATPAPAPVVQASATLSSPSDNRFPWNIEKAITVALNDPQGAAVSPVTCQSANASLIAVSTDCSKVTLGRLGAQSIIVSGGGHSASVTLQGVPQRHWSGQHGVQAEYDSSLIALGNGTVLSWGSNEDLLLGQTLLRDVLPYSSLPISVLATDGATSLSQIFQVSRGRATAFALTEAGNVWAWGGGAGVESMLGQSPSLSYANLPVSVKNSSNSGLLSKVVQVEAGAANAVALIDDGTVVSWGSSLGQGALPPILGRLLPGNVKSPDGSGVLNNIVAISAGGGFSLGLSKDGKVYAWGQSDNVGQRGSGLQHSFIDVDLPNTVKKEDGSDLTNIVSISAGSLFSLALAVDGSVWAWGDNFSAQLGQNGTYLYGVPYAVLVKAPFGNSSGVLGDIAMVVAGGQNAMALDKSGKVWVWGGIPNLSPNCDRTTSDGIYRLPCPLLAQDGAQFSSVASIAAGSNSLTALKMDGTVMMWGLNSYSALGRGDAPNSSGRWIDSPAPAPVVVNAAKTPLILSSLAAYPNLLRRAR